MLLGARAGSKRAAGEWTKAAFPRWNDLITEAEGWAYGNEMKRQADVAAFIRFASERVTAADLLP